ncbi:Clp protease ClpP, partial [Staphylococcus warneri]
SIRNMITPPRNSAPRDTTVTIPAPAVTEPSPVPAVSDEETIRAGVLAEQKARMSGINDLFAMCGGRYLPLPAQCGADPACSQEMARARRLNA